MATLLGGTQQQEKDKDNQQQQSGAVITPIGLTGSGGGGAAPGASAPMTGQQQKPASSGTFTNVRQFVEANRGAGSKIADKATSNIAQNVRQASGQVGQVSALGSDVQQEEQRIGRADQVKQAIQSNPLTLTQDENEFRQARQLITGQTAAEQQRQMLQERAGAAAQALQGAQQQVQGLGTEAGRFGLLRKAVGGPSYSQGQQRLDQLLFQTEGARQIGQTQRELGSELVRQAQTKEQLEQELTNRIGQYQALAGQKAQELTGELGSQKSSLLQAQEEEAQREQQRLNKESTALSKLFSGNLEDPNAAGISAEEKARRQADLDLVTQRLSDVGLTRDTRTFNVLSQGYSPYLQNFNRTLSGADVLDEAEAQRYNALARLAGLDESSFKQAGSGAGQVTIDPKLKRDIDSAQKQLDDYISGRIFEIDSEFGYGSMTAEEAKRIYDALASGQNSVVGTGRYTIGGRLIGEGFTTDQARNAAGGERVIDFGARNDGFLGASTSTGRVTWATQANANIISELAKYLENSGYHNRLDSIRRNARNLADLRVGGPGSAITNKRGF
jgi:hypothetical protein